MSATTSSQGVELTGARASSAVMCPRRSFYDHQGAPRRVPTDDEQGWWKRGTIIEDAVVAEVRAHYAAEGITVETQKEVPWPRVSPIGTGHADMWMPEERHVVEVSSNTGAELLEHKALQAGLYALNLEAETAEVFAVDASCPTRFKRYPISLEGLTPRIHAIEEAVVVGVLTGTPPARVCAHPDDAPAFQCPYREHCFADWVWPDAVTLDGHLDLVEALADAQDAVGRAKRLLDAREERRDAARAPLRPLLEPGVRSRPPGFKSLKRTVTAGRRSFSLSAFEKAGHELDDTLAAFVNEGDPGERWTITRDEAA